MRKVLETKKDYKNYYVKKFASILLPYLIITFLLTLCEMLINKDALTISLFLKNTYEAFMYKNASTHLWYLYTLIGLLIAAPFMAKMLNACKNWELNIIFICAIVWNIFQIYLTKDFGISFSYSGWFLAGWPLYFFLGYYCKRIVNNQNRKYLYIAGGICFVINSIARFLWGEQYAKSCDLAVTYVLFSMALFVFWQTNIKLNNTKLNTALSYIARHSFTIYMVHCIVIDQITNRIRPLFTHGSINYVVNVFITFSISFLIAILLDTILFSPLEGAIIRRFCS